MPVRFNAKKEPKVATGTIRIIAIGIVQLSYCATMNKQIKISANAKAKIRLALPRETVWSSAIVVSTFSMSKNASSPGCKRTNQRYGGRNKRNQSCTHTTKSQAGYYNNESNRFD